VTIYANKDLIGEIKKINKEKVESKTLIEKDLRIAEKSRR